MAGRFKVLTDVHWSRAHIKAVSPGCRVRFLEHLVSEDVPFAGIIRFVAPAD